MRKRASYERRCKGGMAFVQAELARIKKAHSSAIAKRNEYGGDLTIRPKDSPETKRTKEWLFTVLIELPAQGHLVATMCDVLQEILVEGQVLTKKELSDD